MNFNTFLSQFPSRKWTMFAYRKAKNRKLNQLMVVFPNFSLLYIYCFPAFTLIGNSCWLSSNNICTIYTKLNTYKREQRLKTVTGQILDLISVLWGICWLAGVVTDRSQPQREHITKIQRLSLWFIALGQSTPSMNI